MADLTPRSRKPRPAPAEPPVGAVATETASQPAAAPTSAKASYDIPHDLEWTQTKTMRMTRDHEELLNELKFRHGLKIQEAVWYALEYTYGSDRPSQ